MNAFIVLRSRDCSFPYAVHHARMVLFGTFNLTQEDLIPTAPLCFSDSVCCVKQIYLQLIQDCMFQICQLLLRGTTAPYSFHSPTLNNANMSRSVAISHYFTRFLQKNKGLVLV